MSKDEFKLLRDAIIKGVELSQKKLLEKKKKEDSFLVLYRNHRILKINAKELQI